MRKVKTIGTHNGLFHADDVFAVAALLVLFPEAEVVRTRDQDVLDRCDLVLDVGGVYDPDKLRFDHHQKPEGGGRFGAGCREGGVPYSAFGLVWKHFGARVVGGTNAGETADVAAWIDRSLVQAICARDNGWHPEGYEGGAGPVMSLSRAVSGFNPTWESNVDFDTAFAEAVGFAQGVLHREVATQWAKKRAARLWVNSCLRAKGRIVQLDKFIPWTRLNATSRLLYVVFPAASGKNWMLQCIPPKPGSFEKRKPLPEAWAGLRGEELAALTGVSGAVFCHNGRFIAGAKTRKGAVDLARLAVAE